MNECEIITVHGVRVNAPSTETGDIGSRRWHRQKSKLVRLVRSHDEDEMSKLANAL